MCGIAVMFGLNGRPADADVVARMSAALEHRGPDDHGLYVSGSVGLGFRRLSILDLSPAGHQPMSSADGRFTLVFNGEIYNYVELREELRKRGRHFRSSGDTEVLIQAYDEWGERCVERFNGMWAFALFDAERQSLIVSRDRFGVKPLFRYRGADFVLFASEIKAILASGLYEGSTNWEVASRFLLRGDLDIDHQSFYEGIERVQPGTIAEIAPTGADRCRKFWSLDSVGRTERHDPAAEFRETFRDAVRIRMRSDVPVGVFLSGGLDSTSIICMMAAERERTGHSGSPLQAFSYMSDEYDEAAYIKETVARTGADFEEVPINPERLWEELSRVLWHHDEPVHSPTALVGFELMRRARARGTTVILNGQGADETLAGYWNYVHAYWTELVMRGRFAHAAGQMVRYCRAHNRSLPLAMRHVLASAVKGAVTDTVPAGWLPRKPVTADADTAWCSPDLIEFLGPRGEPKVRGLRSALQRSIDFRPLPLFLRIEDRNSMAHSIEARLPFMDYRLVELAIGLPSEWKVRAPWNKFILRESMGGVIPESVRTRLDKMGFPTSARRWTASAWYEPMQDLFGSQSFHERGVFNVAALRSALERHQSDGSDHSAPLFAAAEFELWCRQRAGDTARLRGSRGQAA
jgi:asparagine synthase (glutamine-hydrolysing)